MKFCNLIVAIQVVGLLPCLCHAGMLNWLLGRETSPFNPFNSDKGFETLLEKADQVAVSTPSEKKNYPEEDGLSQALSSIPFELSVADEKFIADAQKYSDLSLSELDICQHKLILQLKTDCNELTEEDLSKLGVNLLNCQSALEERPIYPCSSSMTLKECTRNMDSDTWNAYHIMSNRARSVCYAARQQQFRALTQMTVNKLMASAGEQLEFIHELKEEQKELGVLASETLGSISKGQETLMEQQHHLQMSQEVASKQIGQTMREVSRERSAALASQRQMASLSQTLKATLDQATMMVREQENERQVAQQRLLESLTNVENHVGDVWNQLEESVAKLLDQQSHAVHLQTETVQTLERLNQTFQFLLSVSEHTKEQLDWIQGLVGKTEKRLGKLSTWLVHMCHLFLGMLLLSFLQAPTYTRWIFMFLVPVNLAMDLQQGYVMEVPAVITLLLAASLIIRIFIYLKAKFTSSGKDVCKASPVAISYSPKTSSPSIFDYHKKIQKDFTKEPENLSNFSFTEHSLFESSVNRSSTPLPTLDLQAMESFTKVKSHMPSVLQDRLDLNDSIASRVSSVSYRRNSRIATGTGSVHDESPNRSLTASSKGGTRRPMTPKKTCAGTRQDGTSCRGVPSKDSIYCWQHK